MESWVDSGIPDYFNSTDSCLANMGLYVHHVICNISKAYKNNNKSLIPDSKIFPVIDVVP